jgi:hypothetical protein
MCSFLGLYVSLISSSSNFSPLPSPLRKLPLPLKIPTPLEISGPWYLNQNCLIEIRVESDGSEYGLRNLRSDPILDDFIAHSMRHGLSSFQTGNWTEFFDLPTAGWSTCIGGSGTLMGFCKLGPTWQCLNC